VNRADFQDLADSRIAEAKWLITGGMYESAFYMAGYAVECGLKACIAKLTNQFDFPPRNTQRDCYTHDFAVLLETAQLEDLLLADRKANSALDISWSTVRTWKEDCRYNPRGSKTLAQVQSLILAIEDPQHGVLTWLRQYW
jgi:HEPN domain-containing protein